MYFKYLSKKKSTYENISCTFEILPMPVACCVTQYMCLRTQLERIIIQNGKCVNIKNE